MPTRLATTETASTAELAGTKPRPPAPSRVRPGATTTATAWRSASDTLPATFPRPTCPSSHSSAAPPSRRPPCHVRTHVPRGSTLTVPPARCAIPTPPAQSVTRPSADPVGRMPRLVASSLAQADPLRIVRESSPVSLPPLAMRRNPFSADKTSKKPLPIAAFRASRAEATLVLMAKVVSHTHSVMNSGRMPYPHRRWHQFLWRHRIPTFVDHRLTMRRLNVRTLARAVNPKSALTISSALPTRRAATEGPSFAGPRGRTRRLPALCHAILGRIRNVRMGINVLVILRVPRANPSTAARLSRKPLRLAQIPAPRVLTQNVRERRHATNTRHVMTPPLQMTLLDIRWTPSIVVQILLMQHRNAIFPARVEARRNARSAKHASRTLHVVPGTHFTVVIRGTMHQVNAMCRVRRA